MRTYIDAFSGIHWLTSYPLIHNYMSSEIILITTYLEEVGGDLESREASELIENV